MNVESSIVIWWGLLAKLGFNGFRSTFYTRDMSDVIIIYWMYVYSYITYLLVVRISYLYCDDT